jgi:hypothetical protein
MASELATLTLRRVDNTIRQLLNDMNTVTEARCRFHGTGGGTTANSASVLLPLIGIEIVAQRTRADSESFDESLRRVLREIADVVGYRPYSTVGFAMFKLCRNGLAHGFYPNDAQPLNGDGVGVIVSFWVDHVSQRSVCVREVGPHAESDHLVMVSTGDSKLTKVSAQHLFLDVEQYLGVFLDRLHSDADVQMLVERRDQELLARARFRSLESLSEADLIALGN